MIDSFLPRARCGGWRSVLALASMAGIVAAFPAWAFSQPPIAARVDPYVEKVRVLVLTDIANEPDDQMSMVRFLVCSNQFDVEGFVATTSTWMRNNVRPDGIHTLIDAYGQVQPTLAKHQAGFPPSSALHSLVSAGQSGFGMAAVGSGKTSKGAEAIIRAADRDDPRPLWITGWRMPMGHASSSPRM